MSIPMNRIWSMPAFSPYFPAPPARYRDVRFQWVTFRTDAAIVDRYLPECFSPAADGECLAFGLDAGWCANYGSFQEAGLLFKCHWGDQAGFFCPVVYLNSRGSIPAGRELYGTPKVAAEIAVTMDERVMSTEVRLAGAVVMAIRSTMQLPAMSADLPAMEHAWRIKAIPRADGKGLDVLQLIDCAHATSDVTTHIIRKGDGVIEFAPSPIYDLSPIVPRDYRGAVYTEMDYTEGYAEIVHDFLNSSDEE
ncbi:MAG: acetoacetate decarboxylase family protein [Planctomycetaceae bacterium]